MTRPFTLSSIDIAPTSCSCSSRDWTLLAGLRVVADFTESVDHAAFHWTAAGWAPCVVSEPEYRSLTRVASQLGMPVATFGEWFEFATEAAAEVNRQPFEHWLGEYRTAARMRLEVAQETLGALRDRVAVQESQVRVQECRMAVAELDDLRLARVANRLLTDDWPGTPAELLSTAASVML